MIPAFYTSNPGWPGQIEHVVELLGRISAIEELSGRAVELRRTNRIRSVHSSTAIEGNELTLAQVEQVAHGESVFAPPREITEVANALAAYEALDDFDPWSVDDFLRAHSLLAAGLVTEAGAFRTVDVDIVNPAGDVVHSGSTVGKVPRLVAEMFEWARASSDHPIVVSSATHFLIEHIHPFRDGNGRIGRLWQTLILSRWRPAFAWIPTESLIRARQDGYYAALQASRHPEIDAAVFIDYMLTVITEALTAYGTITPPDSDVGTSVGTDVGIKESIMLLLRAEPTITAAVIAERIGRSSRTIERHLAALQSSGAVRREGSRKSGRWVVQQ